MRSPRQDVRRNKQFTHGQFAHAAAPAKIVEHGIAEILLTTPQLYAPGHLGQAMRRTPPHAHAFFREHFEFAALVRAKQRAQRTFTRRNRFIEVGVKLIPYGSVERACARESLDAAEL